MYDIIVIGAGPAGISAGIYAKMAGAKVLVLYSEKSNIQNASHINNYYGFDEGITGAELFNKGLNQANKIGIEIKEEVVIDVFQEEIPSYFLVETSKEKYQGKSVILACGDKKNKPNIDGLDKYEGKGVSYCAVCDGFFFKNKNLVVIGNDSQTVKDANYLKDIASEVTILTNGQVMEEKTDFSVNSKIIKSIEGDNKVKSVSFDDGSFLCVDGVFVTAREFSGIDFARKIGIVYDGDYIKVDNQMNTNIPGVFACGNITGGLMQICKATYEGALAGLSATNYIKSLKKG